MHGVCTYICERDLSASFRDHIYEHYSIDKNEKQIK